jgi:hypothetical protein
MTECRNCKYWNNEKTIERGQCRLAPPSAVLVPVQGIGGQGMTLISYWPETGASEWCGSFALDENPKALHIS